MKTVTVELSDDGKRLWVVPDDTNGKPSECIDIPQVRRLKKGERDGMVGRPGFPALLVGLAVQRALSGEESK